MKSIITLISVLFYSLPLALEISPYIIEGEQSKLSVTGTSTLHPWEIELQEMNCTADVELLNNQLQINELVFIAKVESLKSEHGKMMDKKTYNAFKSEKYPEIKFTLQNSVTLEVTNGLTSGELIGELYMAGSKRSLTLKINGEASDGSIKLVGEKTIKMTDFEMEPPTALMGTIKTGNEVTIHYAIKLKSK